MTSYAVPVVAFTGGGTGGHIYPALAVAEELSALAAGRGGVRIVWIGNEAGMDRGIVERAGIEFFGIPCGKFRRDLSLKNLSDMFRIFSGYFKARKILSALKPALLFSKGGFVSVPPCYAAKSLNIPVFSHESDASPGLATRLCAQVAQRIFLAYASTAKGFPKRLQGKLEVSGNPVMRAVFSGDAHRGRQFLGIDTEKPLILFLGGSQGARQVNELARACAAALAGRCYIAHQTGEGNQNPAASENPPGYFTFPYLHGELHDLRAAADIMVGRAGAGIIWECAVREIPMILIPLCGASTRGDQVLNADLFQNAGAAISLAGQAASAERLIAELSGLIDDSARRQAMSKAAMALAGEAAAPRIAQRIMQSLEQGGKS